LLPRNQGARILEERKQLILVRHGQYRISSNGEEDGRLSAAGLLQARFLARCLSEMPVDSIVSSTMHRAIETAKVVSDKLPDVTFEQDEDLCEVIPTIFPGLNVEEDAISKARDQADRAFDTYFNGNGEVRCQVLVCHGNLIRYLICRALRIPGEHWMNMMIHNGSISRVVIGPDDQPSLRSYNETFHIPRQLLSQSALRS
jgi:serine/threonine-protein phosphatase PGAM5